MGLRGRLRRLEADAHKDMVFVHLADGGTRIFGTQEALTEVFLAQYGLIVGEPRPSEVLDAVRRATPESRASFEAEYGSIEMGTNIIAPEDEGGWVESRRLLEDGTVETVRHEGGSEEAERIRREARERGPGAGSRKAAAGMAPDPEWSRSLYSAAWTEISAPIEDLSE